MTGDTGARWAKLAIRVVTAFLGSYLAAQAAGGHGVATFIPAIIAALTTLEAGLSQSPSGPVETLNVNPPGDPVITQEKK